MAQELREHQDAGSGFIHRLTNWRFQDTASRVSLANQFVHADIDKMCYDMQTELYYMLEAVNPSSGAPTWKELPAVTPDVAGEINTISSVGGAVSLVASPPKAGVDLHIKSLVQGDNILLTLNSTTVRIDAVLPSVDPVDPSLITYLASGALGGHRVVSLASNTQVVYTDPTSYSSVRKIVGISTGAAINGAPIVVKTSGVLIEPGWTWTVGGDVWATAAGLLTQTIPSSGYLVPIGTALSATSIELNFGLIIHLS